MTKSHLKKKNIICNVVIETIIIVNKKTEIIFLILDKLAHENKSQKITKAIHPKAEINMKLN